jgi:hypothetical protein
MSEAHDSRGRRVAWAAAAALVLAGVYALAHGDCIDTFFYLDDFPIMGQASEIRSLADAPKMLVPPTSFVLYRPLGNVGYFVFLRAFFGHDPLGYHLAHLGFHVTNAFLIYLIAVRLLRRRPAALAGAVIYATTPGLALGACWIATWTMTGTALFYLLALLAWLGRDEAPWRRVATFVCFVLALASSEHGLTLPVTLTAAALLVEPTRPWRTLARDLAPFYALATLYAGAKLFYALFLFPRLDPDVQAFIRWAYGVTFDPLAMLRHLGQYLGYSVSFAYPLAFTERFALVVGIAVLGVVIGTTLLALRRPGATRLRVAAFGLVLFAIALGPVMVLRDHLFSYYVGTAAAGAALTLAALLPARGVPGALAPAIVGVAAVAVALTGSTPRMRATGEFGMYYGYARQAASWLYTVTQAAPGVREFVVPYGPVTHMLFDAGRGHELLLCADYDVVTAKDLDAVAPAPGRVVLREPLPLPHADAPPRTWPWLPRRCAG